MDVHVPRPVTLALRTRGIDVLTAQEDGSARLADADLLARATALGRVLVTQDDDFVRVGVRLQREQGQFGGIVYAHQVRVPIGLMIRELELIAKAMTIEEWPGRIEYLPLQ